MSREAEVEAMVAAHYQPAVDEDVSAGYTGEAARGYRDSAGEVLRRVLPELPAGLPGRLIALFQAECELSGGSPHSWTRSVRKMLEDEVRRSGEAGA